MSISAASRRALTPPDLEDIHTDTPSTTPPAVPVHVNDLVVEYGQTSGNVTSEAYYGGDG